MARAMDVANYLISLRDLDEKNDQYFSLSNLKLQKLLYYCHGGHYRWDKKRLITDHSFEAWDYGPVIDDVYQNFKKYGQSDVHSNTVLINLKRNEKETIDLVWEELKNSRAFDLVAATHTEQPWKFAKKNDNIFIKDEHIRDFFIEEDEVIQ